MIAMILASALAAAPAALYSSPTPSRPYDPAPWWMREPVIASLGEVRTELPANRATLRAAYEVVDRSVATATRAAGDKVRALGSALAPFGPDRVSVATTFETRPLYAQYRDKDGQLVDNARDDKIDRYAVTANVAVEIRDTKLVERVYTAMIAAQPTSTSPAFFRLEPDNETNTELFGFAVADAARRAKLATAATGARLGAVKLIDPTGRACQTDVLVAGAPRSFGGGGEPQEVVMSARRFSMADTAPPADVPPPPPLPIPPTVRPAGSSALDPALLEAQRLPLQPPLEALTREACVVYALGSEPPG